jgi:hypothetical protein
VVLDFADERLMVQPGFGDVAAVVAGEYGAGRDGFHMQAEPIDNPGATVPCGTPAPGFSGSAIDSRRRGRDRPAQVPRTSAQRHGRAVRSCSPSSPADGPRPAVRTAAPARVVVVKGPFSA